MRYDHKWLAKWLRLVAQEPIDGVQPDIVAIADSMRKAADELDPPSQLTKEQQRTVAGIRSALEGVLARNEAQMLGWFEMIGAVRTAVEDMEQLTSAKDAATATAEVATIADLQWRLKGQQHLFALAADGMMRYVDRYCGQLHSRQLSQLEAIGKLMKDGAAITAGGE